MCALLWKFDKSIGMYFALKWPVIMYYTILLFFFMYLTFIIQVCCDWRGIALTMRDRVFKPEDDELIDIHDIKVSFAFLNLVYKLYSFTIYIWINLFYLCAFFSAKNGVSYWKNYLATTWALVTMDILLLTTALCFSDIFVLCTNILAKVLSRRTSCIDSCIPRLPIMIPLDQVNLVSVVI